jgi:hypothetical protein
VARVDGVRGSATHGGFNTTGPGDRLARRVLCLAGAGLGWAGRVEYSGLAGGASGELRGPGAVGGVPDGAGTKLDAALSHAIVAFEADGYERDGSSGWSVMVQGQADPLTGQGRLAEVEGKGLRSWALDGWADRLMAIAGPEAPSSFVRPHPSGAQHHPVDAGSGTPLGHTPRASGT